MGHFSRLNPRFYQGWLISLFRGPIRDLVYALEHDNARWALDDLSRVAEYDEGLGDYFEDAILVPVPLHARKLRERGYNQSELIVREIGKRFSCEIGINLLERTIDTPSQTQFNRKEYSRNLRNAFSIEPNVVAETKKGIYL